MSNRLIVLIALVAGLLTGGILFAAVVAFAPAQTHAAATPALPTPSPSSSPTPSPTPSLRPRARQPSPSAGPSLAPGTPTAAPPTPTVPTPAAQADPDPDAPARPPGRPPTADPRPHRPARAPAPVPAPTPGHLTSSPIERCSTTWRPGSRHRPAGSWSSRTSTGPSPRSTSIRWPRRIDPGARRALRRLARLAADSSRPAGRGRPDRPGRGRRRRTGPDRRCPLPRQPRPRAGLAGPPRPAGGAALALGPPAAAGSASARLGRTVGRGPRPAGLAVRRGQGRLGRLPLPPGAGGRRGVPASSTRPSSEALRTERLDLERFDGRLIVELRPIGAGGKGAAVGRLAGGAAARLGPGPGRRSFATPRSSRSCRRRARRRPAGRPERGRPRSPGNARRGARGGRRDAGPAPRGRPTAARVGRGIGPRGPSAYWVRAFAARSTTGRRSSGRTPSTTVRSADTIRPVRISRPITTGAGSPFDSRMNM